MSARAAKGAKVREPVHPNPSDADAVRMVAPRDQRRVKVSDAEVARMLEAAGGFRTRVAKQLGVSASAISKRIARSPALQEAVRNVEDTVLDIAESALVRAAQNGEPWAVCFILKCKGRARGWIEKHDLSVEAAEDRPPFVLGLLPVGDPGADGGGFGAVPASADVVDVR